MREFTKAKKLQIFISNTDKFKNEPLYEVIIYAAKKSGLSGATAIKGVMGFGGSSEISNLRFWEVTDKIPIIVQIIDNQEKIEKFIDKIMVYFDKIEKGCIITIEDVEIVINKTGRKKI